MNKFLFPILALILVACASSPAGSPTVQVTVTDQPTLMPLQVRLVELVDNGQTAEAQISPPEFTGGGAEDRYAAVLEFDGGGQPDLVDLKEYYAGLGFELDEASLTQLTEAAQKLKEKGQIRSVEVACANGQWVVVGRGADGKIMLPVLSGDTIVIFESLADSADAQVMVYDRVGYAVKFGSKVLDEHGNEVQTFMQFYDGETWVWNESALEVFAHNQGIELGSAAQELAQQGMIVDRSGALWQYDVTKNEMKQLALPDGEYARLTMQDDKLVAVDANGEVVSEFNQATGAWGEVEKANYVFAHNYALRRALENIEIPKDYVPLTYDDGSQVPLGYLGNFGGSHVFSVVGLKVIHMSDYDTYYNDQARGIAFGFVFDGTEVRMNFMTTPQAPWMIHGPII